MDSALCQCGAVRLFDFDFAAGDIAGGCSRAVVPADGEVGQIGIASQHDVSGQAAAALVGHGDAAHAIAGPVDMVVHGIVTNLRARLAHPVGLKRCRAVVFGAGLGKIDQLLAVGLGDDSIVKRAGRAVIDGHIHREGDVCVDRAVAAVIKRRTAVRNHRLDGAVCEIPGIGDVVAAAASRRAAVHAGDGHIIGLIDHRSGQPAIVKLVDGGIAEILRPATKQGGRARPQIDAGNINVVRAGFAFAHSRGQGGEDGFENLRIIGDGGVAGRGAGDAGAKVAVCDNLVRNPVIIRVDGGNNLKAVYPERRGNLGWRILAGAGLDGTMASDVAGSGGSDRRCQSCR